MKVLISEYARAVLAVAVALLLFALLLNDKVGNASGIWGQIELTAIHEQAEGGIREENIVHEKLRKREAPVIIYKGKFLRAGQECDVDELFDARDCEGNVLQTEVLEINGTKQNGKGYRFPVSGIYQIRVMAKDTYNLSTEEIILIPVEHLPFGKEKRL